MLLICTTKIDTTNRIIAIVNEATWWCKWVHAKANKQKTISSNRIESFSFLPNRPNRPALVNTGSTLIQAANDE